MTQKVTCAIYIFYCLLFLRVTVYQNHREVIGKIYWNCVEAVGFVMTLVHTVIGADIYQLVLKLQH